MTMEYEPEGGGQPQALPLTKWVSLSRTPHPSLVPGPDGTYGVWTDDPTPPEQVQRWWEEEQRRYPEDQARQQRVRDQDAAGRRATRDRWLVNENQAGGVAGRYQVRDDGGRGTVFDASTGTMWTLDRAPGAALSAIASIPQGLDWLTEHWREISPAGMKAVQAAQAGAPPAAPAGSQQTPAAAPGTAPSGSQQTAPPPGQTQLRPLDDLMARVRSEGWSALTPQELESYLGKPAAAGQSAALAQNFLWGEGFNPQDLGAGGTPAYNFLAGLVPSMYNLAGFETAITGAGGNNQPLASTEAAQRAMRAGQTGFYTDRATVQDRLDKLDALLARGAGSTAGETALAGQYGGEAGMDDLEQLVSAAYGGTLSPFMRKPFASAVKGLRNKYLQLGTTGGRYSQFLNNMLRTGAI